MRNKKYSFRMYTAWDYEREIMDLNKESDKGWQLILGGCFHSVFEKDAGVKYRYQLDYNTDIDNRMRYKDTFMEQGWEYINSTFNGWHYFRKIYDPSLPEEEYEIYTDSSYLPEVRTRWIRIAKILIVMLSILLALTTTLMAIYPEITRIPTLLQYTMLIVLMSNGVRKMSRTDKKFKSMRGGAVIGIIIFVTIAGTFFTSWLNEMRPHMSMGVSNDVKVKHEVKDLIPDAHFEVKYADNYYFDIDITCSNVINFILLDEEGKTVFSKSCENDDINIDNKRLWLTKGDYQIKVQTGSLESGPYDVKWSVD